MKEEFEKKVYELLEKLDLKIKLKIVYIKDSYNSLFVESKSEEFILYVDIEEIYKKRLEFEPFILHELYHIKQFLNKFPIIITNESKFFIIQKIITDLYVDLDLIRDNYYQEARVLFLHRINNLKKIVNSDLNFEDIYRIGLLYFEGNNVFKNECVQIEDNFIKINDKRAKKKIKDIYTIINKHYQEKNNLYEELIKFEDSKKELLIFDNKIII